MSFIKSHKWELVILCVFISLRLVNIGSEEYWYDEYYNLLVAYRLSPLEIIEYVRHIHHPPFYYLLLSPWLNLFGVNEIFGRLPALLFSVLVYILIIKILNLLKTDAWIKYLTLVVITFSSFNVEYSQEARPYTLMLFYYFWLFYIILNSLLKNKISNKMLWLIFCIATLSLYTHYLSVVYLTGLIGSLVLLLLKNRKVIALGRKIISMIIFGFITFIPWAIFTFTKDYSLSAYTNITSSEVQRNFLFLISAMVYFPFFTYTIWVFSSLVFFIFVWIIWVNKNAILSSRLIYFCVVNVLLTLVLIYFSPLSRMYSTTWHRHILILNTLFSIIYIFVVSKMVTSINLKLVSLLLFIVLNIYTLPLVMSNDSEWFYHHQYIDVINYIRQNEVDNDLIFTPRMLFDVMIARHYDGNNRITNLLNNNLDVNGLPVLQSADITYKNSNYKLSLYNRGLDDISDSYSRIWLINSYTSEDNFAINYFKNKSGWILNNVKLFPNNRLYLLEKNN